LTAAIGIPGSSNERTVMKDNRTYLLYGSGVGKAPANSALGGTGEDM